MALKIRTSIRLFLIGLLSVATLLSVRAEAPQSLDISLVQVGDETQLALKAINSAGYVMSPEPNLLPAEINGTALELSFIDGMTVHPIDWEETKFVLVKSELGTSFFKAQTNEEGKPTLRNIPLWLSIIPPLVAILLALIFKEVIVALFVGIWSGVFILNGFSFTGIFSTLLAVVDTYLLNALADADHASVIIFSLLIGGMVAIISRNGGMAGVVDKLSGLANSARNSQLVTWFLGIAIFFDDYANTLIVGNTMRPVTDKYKVSREKLAYIVDSTAAPIAAVAFITTWIGAEVGYIEEAISSISGMNDNPYSLFLGSLDYAFYPVLTLAFILMLVLMNKDYGPMLKAENRARTTGQVYNREVDRGEKEVDNSLEALDPVTDKHRWYNAFLPIFTVITVSFVALLYTGFDVGVWNDTSVNFFNKVRIFINDSNSYSALLWGSTAGVIVALMLTVGGRLMSLKNTVETLIDGFKTMLPAILILIFAWALGQLTKDLHTADFLTSIMAGNVSAYWMPAITFILAGLIAFSTGSSWSTMAILYPLILPTTWAIGMASGMPVDDLMPIFYNVISCVLAGSVFGDHCSPISDTTILSSLASSCNHIDHVSTQLPYALTVGAVSVFLGLFSVMVGLPAFINFIIGLVILYLVVRFMGKDVASGSQ